MLGKKKRCFIAAFSTTSDAMAAEKALHKAGVRGRLVPVPRELSSGCGMAWACEPEQADMVLSVLAKKEIVPERQTELDV